MKPLRCLSVPSRGDYHRSTYRTNMRRSRRCCSSEERPNRRAWTPEEDKILSEYIEIHGYGDWANLPQKTGLKRHGRSCRLRWLNYLRRDIKRGNISPDEEELLIRMHRLLGNRWSLIAGRLPGRTDNEIKNYWNTHLSKKLAMNAESERRTQILKRRSTSPSPLQNHVFKPRPVKMTTAARDSEIQLRPNGCNGDCSNHIPAEATVKLSNVQETTNSTQSGSCDLLAENLIANHESERIVFDLLAENLIANHESERIAFGMAHVGTEVTNSTCSMSSLKEWQSPHSDYFADTLDQCSMDLDDLSFPDFNLLSSPLDCLLTDFGLEEFYKGPAFIDYRDQSA